MKKRLQRIISLMMIVLLLVSLLPGYALAEEVKQENNAMEWFSETLQAVKQTVSLENLNKLAQKDAAVHEDNHEIDQENLTATAIEGDYEYTVTDGKVRIIKYLGNGDDVIIPGTLGGYPVTEIEDNSFSNCTSLKSILMPDSVTKIGRMAFFSCQSLLQVVLSDSLTEIEELAFMDCQSLQSVTIPKSVSAIRYSTFSHCTAINSVTIPEGVAYIDANAFASCKNLTSITIPRSVIKLGDNAFNNCSNLKNVQFNSNETQIEDITWVFGNDTIPVKATIIGYDPSTAKDYAQKYGNRFQLIGSKPTGPVTPTDQTTIAQNTKSVIVKAKNKAGAEVPVENASVYVYESWNIPLNIGKETDQNKILATGTTDANGKCTLTPPAGGWSKDATVVACKNESYTNDGRKQAREPYDDVVFTVQIHSLKISPNGSWYGKMINDLKNDTVLVLESPRYLCNLSLMYYYNDGLFGSGDYYDDVEKMVAELSEQISESTDGYFAIDKIAVYNTKNKKDFMKTGNIATECDIQINDTSRTWSVTYGNNVGGYYSDKTVTFGSMKENYQIFVGWDYREITDSSVATYSRIEMSALNVNQIAISSTADYTKEVIHEMGHYVLRCGDEYFNANGTIWDQKNKDTGKIVEHPLKNVADISARNFGLMESQYKSIELSKDLTYSYLDTEEKKKNNDLITGQYATNGGSCWSSIEKVFSNISFPATLTTGAKSALNENSFSKLYQLSIQKPTTVSRVFSSYATNETILDKRDVSTAGEEQVTAAANQLVATVKVNSESDHEQVLVSPVTGTPVSLTQMFYDDTTSVEIPLIQDGSAYTGTIPVQKERYYLRLVSRLDNNEMVTSEYLVRSTRNTTESAFIDDDQSVFIRIDSASSDSYNFVTQNSFINKDKLVPLSKAVYITSKDKVAVKESMIISDVSSNALVNIDTLSWYKYDNEKWTAVSTTKQTGDYNSVSAGCSYDGEGYYILMAEPAQAETTMAKIENLTIAPNNSYDGSVDIKFTDGNNKDNVRYYLFYYLDKPFSEANLDVASRQMLNTYDSAYGYTFSDLTKTYYGAIQAVGYDGSVSPLSEIKTCTPGVRDEDNDGIPDEWVEKYGLKKDDNSSGISTQDKDSDGLTNLDEYKRNSNPEMPDTDGDGVRDGEEVAKGLNPLEKMTDGKTSDYVAAFGESDFNVADVKLATAQNSKNSVDITLENLKNKTAKDVNVKLYFDGVLTWCWQTDFEPNKKPTLSYVFEGDQPKVIEVVVDDEQKRGDLNYANNTFKLHTDPSSTENPICSYRTHVQNIGWQEWKQNGAMSGTEGLAYRLEGLEIKLNQQGYDLGIEYRTHVENIGWQELKRNGQMSGTSGLGLRLEAVQIKLTGTDADKFDVYYRVHAQNVGWMDWAKNGAQSGTAGFGYRLEGIRIVVIPKGNPAPGSTDRPFLENK